MRGLAQNYLPKPKHEFGPALSIVDGLVAKGVLDGLLRSRVDKVARLRNAAVHGVSVPTDSELGPVLEELRQLQTILEKLPKSKRG